MSRTSKTSLPPATKLRQCSVSTPVCDSVHRGGVCVQGSLSIGGLCPLGSLSRGVSVQGVSAQTVSVWGSLSRRGGLCPGGGSQSRGSLSRGSLSRGSLSRGLYPGGLSPGSWGLCLGGLGQGDPPYGNVRVVHILVECILVVNCKKSLTLLRAPDFVIVSVIVSLGTEPHSGILSCY